MGTKLRDHKMLWGRANGKCSICNVQLAQITELGHSSIIGEEAHIVARELNGPRGNHSLAPDKRDEYSNLILLCPTHHTEIDKIPAGVESYPVDRLIEIKQTHEQGMLGAGQADRQELLREEQWAGLIDELGERFSWNDWEQKFEPIFHGEGPNIGIEFHDRLQAAAEWIYTRVWPSGNDRLREAVQTMGTLANDFVRTFDLHVAEPRSNAKVYKTERFYKIREWDPDLYKSLLADYKSHVDLLQDLSFELTRYGNLIADIVREAIDPAYRFNEGVLVVRSSDFFSWQIFRPEFSAEERIGQPYQGLDDFKSSRYTRSPHTVPDSPAKDVPSSSD